MTSSTAAIGVNIDLQETLVARAVGRDENAFAELYVQHVDRVYRHLYYRVGSRQEAEDLTQQVFLKAWQGIERYREGAASFLPWLITIAHRLGVDHYRKKGRAKEVHEQEAYAVPGSEAPDLAVEHSQQQEILRRAITRLRGDRQLVILLRFVEQFDYAQVAAVLGKKEGAVRVLQHRALAELRGILENELGYEL